MDPFVWNYVLEKRLGRKIHPSTKMIVYNLSPPPLTVSVAATNPVRAVSLLNNNDMSMQFPNLSHAIDDDDGYFDPTDPLVNKLM